MYVVLMKHNNYHKEKQQKTDLLYFIERGPFLLDLEQSSLIYFARSFKNNPPTGEKTEEDWDSGEAVFY